MDHRLLADSAACDDLLRQVVRCTSIADRKQLWTYLGTTRTGHVSLKLARRGHQRGQTILYRMVRCGGLQKSSRKSSSNPPVMPRLNDQQAVPWPSISNDTHRIQTNPNPPPAPPKRGSGGGAPQEKPQPNQNGLSQNGLSQNGYGLYTMCVPTTNVRLKK